MHMTFDLSLIVNDQYYVAYFIASNFEVYNFRGFHGFISICENEADEMLLAELCQHAIHNVP